MSSVGGGDFEEEKTKPRRAAVDRSEQVGEVGLEKLVWVGWDGMGLVWYGLDWVMRIKPSKT